MLYPARSRDFFSTVQSFISYLDSSARYGISLFEIVNDVSDYRLFALVSGKQFHTDRYLVCIKEKSQSNYWLFFVFFGWSFFSEVIFLIDFKIEVGTIEVRMRCIKLVRLLNLMVIDFNNLFVFATNIFKTIIKLIQRENIRIKELRNL